MRLSSSILTKLLTPNTEPERKKKEVHETLRRVSRAITRRIENKAARLTVKTTDIRLLVMDSPRIR
jgi:hypothetical protein